LPYFLRNPDSSTTTTLFLEMSQQNSSRSTSFLEDLELSNNFPLLQTTINDIPSDFLKKPSSNDDKPLFQTRPKLIMRDLLTVSSCSLLISFSYFSNLLLLIINLHFIGRSNEPLLLSSIGLGNVWVNCFAINLVVGFNYGFWSPSQQGLWRWQSLFARAILQARSIGSFVDNVVFFRIIEFLRQDLQSPWPKPWCDSISTGICHYGLSRNLCLWHLQS